MRTSLRRQTDAAVAEAEIFSSQISQDHRRASAPAQRHEPGAGDVPSCDTPWPSLRLGRLRDHLSGTHIACSSPGVAAQYHGVPLPARPGPAVGGQQEGSECRTSRDSAAARPSPPSAGAVPWPIAAVLPPPRPRRCPRPHRRSPRRRARTRMRCPAAPGARGARRRQAGREVERTRLAQAVGDQLGHRRIHRRSDHDRGLEIIAFALFHVAQRTVFLLAAIHRLDRPARSSRSRGPRSPTARRRARRPATPG